MRPGLGPEDGDANRNPAHWLVLNALRRINARLKLLRRTRFVGGQSWTDGANRRTCRATEELLWVKGLLENGGIEPYEWGDDGKWPGQCKVGPPSSSGFPRRLSPSIKPAEVLARLRSRILLGFMSGQGSPRLLAGVVTSYVLGRELPLFLPIPR